MRCPATVNLVCLACVAVAACAGCGASSSSGAATEAGTSSGSGSSTSSGASSGMGSTSGGGSSSGSGSSSGASSGSGSTSGSGSGSGAAEAGAGEGGTGACGAGDTNLPAEPTIPPACATLMASLAVAAGGVPDESALDTSRIQSALDSCASGQAVKLAASASNNAFITGPLTVPTGVTLWVDA